MKTWWKFVACVVIVVGTAMLASAQEPLGDVARRERARPKPQAPKVITNDDIPSVDTPAQAAGETSVSDTKDQKKDAKPLTAEEKIKQMDQWKAKIATQEAKVKSLDNEVIQMERDYKLRMSAYYGDLGLKLRDQAKWDADEKKYKEDIAAKQKARDAERTKLEDMKDEARKAGLGGID